MPLGVDGAWAEVDLRVALQHRLEDRDNRLPERPHERHRDMRAVDGVADALLRRVELCAPERIAGSLELVRDQDGEEQPGEHSDDHAGHPVEHDRLSWIWLFASCAAPSMTMMTAKRIPKKP